MVSKPDNDAFCTVSETRNVRFLYTVSLGLDVKTYKYFYVYNRSVSHIIYGMTIKIIEKSNYAMAFSGRYIGFIIT